jgi:trehalose 6-phosphate phosphatase
VPKLESVTIDPRRHDAVLFEAAAGATETFARHLREAGVRSGVFSSGGNSLIEAADGVSARPGRGAVVATDQAGITAARDLGFALVIGIGDQDALRGNGADAVVSDLSEVGVRTGDRRMSELHDAFEALEGLTARHPAVFYDFDGTLSEIVNDPDAARPVAGASEALVRLAAQCPVAVLSGRDLADVSERVGLPGIWYAGSHGFELTAPDGTHHQNEAAAAAIPVLEQAAAELRGQIGSIPGVAVEHKRFGVAAHYRGVRGGARSRPAPCAAGDDGPRGHRAASRHRLGQRQDAALGH